MRDRHRAAARPLGGASPTLSRIEQLTTFAIRSLSNGGWRVASVPTMSKIMRRRLTARGMRVGEVSVIVPRAITSADDQSVAGHAQPRALAAQASKVRSLARTIIDLAIYRPIYMDPYR